MGESRKKKQTTQRRKLRACGTGSSCPSPTSTTTTFLPSRDRSSIHQRSRRCGERKILTNPASTRGERGRPLVARRARVWGRDSRRDAGATLFADLRSPSLCQPGEEQMRGQVNQQGYGNQVEQ